MTDDVRAAERRMMERFDRSEIRAKEDRDRNDKHHERVLAEVVTLRADVDVLKPSYSDSGSGLHAGSSRTVERG